MLLLVAFLILCVTPAFAGLVTNGTFENNCVGWSYGGFANFCDAASGNPSPSLILNDSPGPVPAANQTIAGLTTGESYILTLDAKSWFNCCNDGSTLGAGANIDGQQFDFLVTNSQPWTTHTFNFTYGGGSNLLVLSSQRNGTDADAQFDNVDIVSAVPEPAGLLLVGSGLTGLLALRRRR